MHQARSVSRAFFQKTMVISLVATGVLFFALTSSKLFDFTNGKITRGGDPHGVKKRVARSCRSCSLSMAKNLHVAAVAAMDIPAKNRFPVDWHPQDTAYACMEVADSGGGISEENIEKVFDPFFSTKFMGRGLGLPVVLGLVVAHGGVVTVVSERGRGSTIQIFLPLSTAEVPLQTA